MASLFRVVRNMYANAKSCVQLNNNNSTFFSCESGVRQGEHLSTLLFSLYVNDLQTYLTDKQNTGVNSEFMENNSVSYIHILVLLCADYTVIVSNSADEFQKCLNDFNQYCMEWN